MNLLVCSHVQIENSPLPSPSAVICMADSREQLAVIKDAANVVRRLDLIFNDAEQPFQIVAPPTTEHARQILAFVDEVKEIPNLVIQCQVGIGRSHAVAAAIMRKIGRDPKKLLQMGTYNRRLYRKLIEAMGLDLPPEPLISMAVRVKYSPDRLRLFILSMQRQRYENWEVVAVTDGPNPMAVRVLEEMQEKRVRLIETEKPMGRWGHPYRQVGLDACRGEFIGMSNDDNYYVPGYLEQMHWALENVDLAVCQILHSYSAWKAVPAGGDLGCWIARTSLVRRVPWEGWEFTADQKYLRALAALAGNRAAVIEKPLFVHN